MGWRRFCGAMSQRPSRVASTSATCGVASEVRGDLIPGLVVATAAEAVQAISSIGDVTRARKSPGTGASTDSSVVIVLDDTSQRPQRESATTTAVPVTVALPHQPGTGQRHEGQLDPGPSEASASYSTLADDWVHR